MPDRIQTVERLAAFLFDLPRIKRLLGYGLSDPCDVISKLFALEKARRFRLYQSRFE